MRLFCLLLLVFSLLMAMGDPLFAEAVGGLVQPGIEGLAQQPPRPSAVQAPEGNAAPAGDHNIAEEKPAAAPKASPFEIRYIMSYVLMLAFVGGSTFLVIRPSGRKIQGDGDTPKAKAAAKGKK